MVDLLSKGIRDGTPYQKLEDQIMQMPQELKDLYADTLRRIEPDYSTEAYVMLQVALCSLTSLPLSAFMKCIDHVMGDVDTSGLRGPESNAPKVFFLLSDRNRLESRSGGLLEPSFAYNPHDISEGDDGPELVVQFIHQTVKEYIQASGYKLPLTNLKPEISREEGNAYLLRSCKSHVYWVSYIKADVFAYARRVLSLNEGQGSEWVNDLIRGALIGQGYFGLDWYLREFSGCNGDLFKFLESELKRHPHEEILSKVAIAMDFPGLVSEDQACHVEGLLHIAVAGPHMKWDSRAGYTTDTLRQLVARGANPNECCDEIIPCIPELGERRLVNQVTPLTVALTLRHADEETQLLQVKQLLELGARMDHPLRALEAIGESGSRVDYSILWHPLTYCVSQHSAAIIRLLLEHSAAQKIKWFRWALYRLAFLRGDDTIIRILSEYGTDEHTVPTQDEEALSLITPHDLASLALIASAPTGALGMRLAGYSRAYLRGLKTDMS